MNKPPADHFHTSFSAASKITLNRKIMPFSILLLLSLLTFLLTETTIVISVLRITLFSREAKNRAENSIMLRDEMRIETLGNFAKYVLERDAAGERGAARRREKRGGREARGHDRCELCESEGKTRDERMSE